MSCNYFQRWLSLWINSWTIIQKELRSSTLRIQQLFTSVACKSQLPYSNGHILFLHSFCWLLWRPRTAETHCSCKDMLRVLYQISRCAGYVGGNTRDIEEYEGQVKIQVSSIEEESRRGKRGRVKSTKSNYIWKCKTKFSIAYTDK